MASTKIPIVCGSRPSKSVPNQTQNLKRTISSLGRRSLDKQVQGFVRYQFDCGTFGEYSDLDEDVTASFDEIHALLPGVTSNVFPIPVNSLSDSRGPRFSSKWNSKCINQQTKKLSGISHNFTDYVHHRSRGFLKNQTASLDCEYGTQQMIKNCLYNEQLLRLKDVNKIFCSRWLNAKQILMGSKCNQLLLYDINSQKTDQIPSLKGSEKYQSNTDQSGNHAIEINPSNTLLATGAQNSNEVAIYRLPTLDPVCTGENAHCDCIFDLVWLDDQFLASASRDKSLAMWKVDDRKQYETPSYGFMEPLARKKCFGADKVRALLFNPNYMEIVALSLNAKVHVWDAMQFKQIMSQELELVKENVCMAQTQNCSIYAIGSKSHVTLIDPRTLQSVSKIDTKKSGPSIRSISFRSSLLTIGTGTGHMLFYDIKAGRYLEGSEGVLELRSSKCQVTVDEAIHSQYVPENNASDSAIYTHCYDWSGTRLFAAGGPLSASFRGCYASLWC